jgi:hypothetical protein
MSVQRTHDGALAGTLLADRYELRALLGRGGMGEVYEAADRRLDRTVAVKVLRAELAQDARFLARFQREARTAARLTHPSIVAVHDYGEDAGRVYLVLEHVQGRTLSQLVRVGARPGPARVASIGAAVADALAHAHARGIVHRDIAPGNVMVRDDGAVKVLDFGIARAIQGPGASVTAHGTVAYAAPEVLGGGQGDQRVDVYGLGSVLYELACGRPPFDGSDIDARLRAGRPPLLRDRRPSIPEGLEETVMRCLEERPMDRPADAASLADELRRLAAFLPATIADEPTGPVDAPTATDVMRTPAVTGVLEDVPRRRRRWSWWARAAVTVSTVTVLGAIGAVVAPTVFRLAQPVAADAEPPPLLAAPVGIELASSCDGFFQAGVDVTWSAVAGASGYEVWRRSTSGEGWTRAASVQGTATSVRDPDLGVDAVYVYRVRALDGPLPGRWSAAATVDTPFLCFA